MYFLDSNICIELLRGHMPAARELLETSPPELFGIPAVVEAELRLGVARSTCKEENRLALESFLAPWRCIPFDAKCAIRYAEICSDLQRRGCVIGPNDMLIAATALAHGAVLVTNNVREFARVPGLVLESWGEIDF